MPMLIRLIRSGINRTDSLNEGTGVSFCISVGLTFRNVTSSNVFLFSLLIALDNSLEKGDEWTERGTNGWMRRRERWREKEESIASSRETMTTGNVEFGHTSPEEIFMGPLDPRETGLRRVEFLSHKSARDN